MTANVLMNSSKKMTKRDVEQKEKMQCFAENFITTSLINLTIQEHKFMFNSIYKETLKLL